MFPYFYSEGHEGFLEDVSITLIDKTDASDPKKRENCCMRTLRNLAPDGLNVEVSVWIIMILYASIVTLDWILFVFILHLYGILIFI